VLALQNRETRRGICLASEGSGAEGYLLSAMSCQVQAGALRGEQSRYIALARQRKVVLLEERTQYLVAFLREHPCADCGEGDPIVLEFDHLRDKRFSISVGLQGRRWQDVLDEIAKCEVVCANCHRRRTAKRGGFRRAAVAQR
jgi:5-methylcytosine-specific restriction endonuclease McrA